MRCIHNVSLIGAAWSLFISGCNLFQGGDCHPSNHCIFSSSSDSDGAETDTLTDASVPPGTSDRRHIIVMIGDGMQTADEVAASRYLYGTDYGLSFHSFPVMTYKTTWDVNVYNIHAAAVGKPEYSPISFEWTVGYDPAQGGFDPYPIRPDDDVSIAYFSAGNWPHPDSASTATAMSTGEKTYSSAIGWSIDGTALTNAPELLRDRYHMSIGLISTVPISHATPAAFFAHNPSRINGQDIAEEILMAIQPEVVIGGGWNDPNYIREVDLDRALSSNQWIAAVPEPGISGDDALLAASIRAKQENKRLLGLYECGTQGNFPAPIPSDTPGNPQIDTSALGRPGLQTASIAALEVLSADPDGFFLMIEQGHIDWANHNVKFDPMIGGVFELDQAVRAVTQFVDRPDDEIDWSNTTLIVTADHANGFLRFVQPLGKGDLPRMVIDNSSGVDVVTYPDGEIFYGAPGSHTSELVTVYVKGFAAAAVQDYEDIYPGGRIIDDTSIFRLTLDASER
jgi:alkaline phosphatase